MLTGDPQLIIDPKNPPNSLRKISQIVNPAQDDYLFTFFIHGNHFVVLSEDIWTNKVTGVVMHLFSQREFPIAAARWLVSGIEDKFIKGPDEGGLPAGVFKNKQEVDGEVLKVGRAMAAGTDGEPGYYLATLSRMPKGRKLAKEMYFTDDLLSKHGFFDKIKAVAQK